MLTCYVSSTIEPRFPRSQEAEWLDEEVETVVEFYQENEFLWTHHLADYKDKNKRSLVVEKLQEMLGIGKA